MRISLPALCGTGAQATSGRRDRVPSNASFNGAAFGASGRNFTGGDIDITGSRVNRWGIGVVQEIDSAAMHLFAVGSTLNSTSTLSISITSAAAQRAVGRYLYQGSRYLHGWWRDLLLRPLIPANRLEAALRGGFFSARLSDPRSGCRFVFYSELNARFKCETGAICAGGFFLASLC